MMNEDRFNPLKKAPERTGLSLFLMVGGFLLLIMILGWLLIASR